jgi:hypothetical protein
MRNKCIQIKDRWWTERATRLQALADANNYKEFFNQLGQLDGPRAASVTNPVLAVDNRTVVSRNGEVMQRKLEYTRGLLNEVSHVDPEALSRITQRPIAHHLAAPPTLGEVEMEINRLKRGKAPGPDGLPAEVWQSTGPATMLWLHARILKAWDTGEVPQQWKDAEIVLLWKRKGSKMDLSTY